MEILRDRKHYELVSQIILGSVYYIDVVSFYPKPPGLAELVRLSGSADCFMTPIKIVDYKTIEFLELEIEGYDVHQRWCIDVEVAHKQFFIRKSETCDTGGEITVKKGKLKGIKGEVLQRFNRYSLIKFGENVGGCSLDGKYDKGRCLFIKDDELCFHRSHKNREKETKKSKLEDINKYRLFPLTKENVAVGLEVVLYTRRHGTHESNPVWGYNDQRITGTIITAYIEDKQVQLPISVLWDNGRLNSYTIRDLLVVERFSE